MRDSDEIYRATDAAGKRDERNEFRSTGRAAFAPFDEHRAVRVYRRNLPHWRQEGATYFVTFRLHDSIPNAVFREWEFEKLKWLSMRGIPCGAKDDWKLLLTRLSDRDQQLFHKHFNRLFHMALDEGRGGSYLKSVNCLTKVSNKLFELDQSTCDLGDFVVMPNHVHLLLTPKPGHELELVMKSLKGSTARLCNQTLGRTSTFWQADSYDHIVRDLEQLVQIRQYIADNPRKASITLGSDAIYRAEWMDRWYSP